MSYSTEISKTLTETLGRFATLNPHQLAGHVANLDFWLGETKHCINVLEGYRKRFEVMAGANGVRNRKLQVGVARRSRRLLPRLC